MGPSAQLEAENPYVWLVASLAPEPYTLKELPKTTLNPKPQALNPKP